MLFDVRFVTDSIAERILRGIHLGVMVGISVLAPQYDPQEQIKGTFQSFSFVLMFSRFVLVAQYLLAVLRQPRAARLGLCIMAAVHGAAGFVYLGIAFRFTNSRTDAGGSRAFVTWYILGFFETVAIFATSWKFKALSFNYSSLPERTKTATLLILGEGVVVVAEHISTVVKNADSWTPDTVAVLAATVALIYIIYQIYFDWSWPTARFMSSEIFLYVWCLFHLPFHICLVLVMEGATQFVVWWKIVEMIDHVSERFLDAYHIAVSDVDTSAGIALRMANHLNETISKIWEHYPPDLFVTYHHRDHLLSELSEIDDSHWDSFPSIEQLERGAVTDERFTAFVEDFRALKITTLNSILKSFRIEAIHDEGWDDDNPATYQETAYEKTADRFNLVVGNHAHFLAMG